jgi:hypothetical protein
VARRIDPKRPARTLETRSAKDAVGTVLALYGIADQIRAERVLTEWAELVGPRISSRTRPYGVTDRVLVIEVASSAWLHELTMLKAQILTGLHLRMGAPRLFDDLRFKLAGGRGNRPAPPRPRTRPEKVEPPPPVPATGVARENIVREVEAVDDLELRELIARVRIGHDR